MKKNAKLILIVLMLAVCIFTVTACNDNIPTLSIAAENMPQTVFVKGNDIDLSKGKLSVSDKNGQQLVALDSEGVTVSGYDKDTVGKQTVTVSYGGASVSLDVTVVERMVAENHTAEYLLGMDFDKKGRLKITRDDGVTFNVNMSDERLTFSGFDTATAGEKAVTVRYKDAASDFEGSFGINVIAADSIELTAPTKKLYNSHDEKINLAGGYLTMTAKDGAITRNIVLDDSMISGYDPTQVSETEPEKKQTIVVKYLDVENTFEITVRLSDVTRVRNNAKTLSAIEWKDALPTVSDTQGKLAVDTYKLFKGLSPSEAELIAKDDLLAFMRPAAVYALSGMNAILAEYAALFEVDGGVLYIGGNTYAETKTAYDAVSQLAEDSNLYVYADMLADLIAQYGDEALYGTVKMNQYLADFDGGETPLDKAAFTTALNKVGLMLSMHEALASIPVQWTMADLNTDANVKKIEEAKSLAVELGQLAQPITERYIFHMVSSWRAEEKDDYFEILYRYYYSLYQSGDQAAMQKGQEAMDALINVCAPGILEYYFQQFINTLLQHYNILYTVQNGQLIQPAADMNTAAYVSEYRLLLSLYNEIMKGDDEMYLELFNVYQMGQRIEMIQSDENGDGIFAIFGGGYGISEFDGMWTKYLETIDVAANDDSDGEKLSAKVSSQIKDMLVTFSELSPAMQAKFIASINPYGIVSLMPYDGTDRTPMFTSLIIIYLMDILPENLIFQGENHDENGLAMELLDALFYYINSSEQADESGSTGLDLFLESMKTAETMYAALSQEDKQIFDNAFGFFYNRYLSIAKLYDSEHKFIEKEISEEWADNIEALENMYAALSTIMMKAVIGDATAYSIFISAYEFTEDLYNQILTSAPQEVKEILLYGQTDMFQDMSASIEEFLYQFREIFITLMTMYPVTLESGMNMWNEYANADISDFMSAMVDFYAAAYSKTNEDGTPAMTLDIVKEAMKNFAALNDDQKALYVLLDGLGTYVYYPELQNFFATHYKDSTAVATLANDLINLELNWITQLTGAQFIEAWEAFAAKYEALSAADKELFDANLKEMYDSYKSLYEELKSEQTQA